MVNTYFSCFRSSSKQASNPAPVILRAISGFLCSHLRTYKRWLVDKIDGTDFQIDGRFYPCAGDLALMFPMVEMAGPAHARFIEDVLYLYNAVNPLNEARVFDPAPYVQTLYDAPIYQPLADREAVPCRLSQHPA